MEFLSLAIMGLGMVGLLGLFVFTALKFGGKPTPPRGYD